MYIRLSLVALLVAGVSCHEGGGEASSLEDATLDADVVLTEVTNVADTADADAEPVLCAVEGGFGCPCSENADCLDELCIEGPDGNFCTKSCQAECPSAFACLNTSLAGSDPISICVPRHTRLCRPCNAQADCQSPLDPAPAACLPGPSPEDGFFCATSCAQDPCPADYQCEDVEVGETTAKLCRPAGHVCDCRPAWAELGLSTTCARANELGSCDGTRECDADGLTACSASLPLLEVCDLEDNDCNGVTDDIAGEACDLVNDEGTCPGLTACDEEGAVICTGREPSSEICNLVDDDCDGDTDEEWPDCPPGTCNLTDTGYVESGPPECIAGHCVHPNPHPCGTYSCIDGGEDGDICANSCEDDSTCAEGSHCDDGECVEDVVSGGACEEDHDCATEHCQNGFCCDEGDCCSDPVDCPEAYSNLAVCDDAAGCQGTRVDARCLESMCASETIEDDSACDSETLALDCSPMVPVFCSAALIQKPPECPANCTADEQCIEGYHCDDDCLPDVEPGGSCDEDSDCAEGVCANGICCDTPCDGICRSCTVADLEGTCSDIPSDSDPDEECPGNACTGYYFGFVDKVCYLRAPVEDADVFCDGVGACETADVVCAEAAQGAESSSCHPICQDPTEGSCAGTTPGACTNITGGQQDCGIGACLRTTDVCSGGVPLECVPGDPAPEVCDGVDNDCDGLTDAEDPDLVLVPCDNQNGVCEGSMRLSFLCTGGAWMPCDDSIYLSHNPAYQWPEEASCETTAVQAGLDNDCDGQIDEDFSYTSPAGTTVQGAARPCGTGVCADGITVCGPTGALVCSTDYLIGLEVCDGKDNDCDGLLDSIDTNDTPLKRVQCENQVGVCNGSLKPNSLCVGGAWQTCVDSSYSAHNDSYVATEIDHCDGLDNDCDGGIDNNLSAPNNSNQNGACAGTKQKCTGQGGWVDDYVTVPGYDQPETPDASYADENCDGIDGDVDQALFVVAGASGSSRCTMNSPCNLPRALALASSSRSHIYLREGNHTGPFAITKVVQIYGGYSGNDWSRANRTSHTVNILGGNVAPDNHTAVFTANGVGTSNDPIVIADLFIRGKDATARVNNIGASSYGIFNQSSYFRLERVEVVPGAGRSGANGGNGSSASSSAAPRGSVGTNGEESADACDLTRPSGGVGGNNSCSGSTSTRGGRGGSGGSKDTCCDNPCGWLGTTCYECTTCNCDATAGATGDDASVTTSTRGNGGSGGGTCNVGRDGQNGRVVNGSGGSGASSGNAYGYVASDGFWFPLGGGAGTLGENGGGGGGGGGSGGCDAGIDSRGAGGGGGGAGGCRAPVTGKGGFGGGGSFGLFAIDGGFHVVGPATLQIGAGGKGGNGGSGGTGQPGGAGRRGGYGAGDSLQGGDGGDGGRGGHSGGGGGGAGGASIAVLVVDGSWSKSGTITYSSLPNAAVGGSGGTTGISGSKGTDGPVATLKQCTSSTVWGIRFVTCN